MDQRVIISRGACTSTVTVTRAAAVVERSTPCRALLLVTVAVVAAVVIVAGALAARIAAVISTAAIAVGAIEAPITPGCRAHS